VQYDTSLVEAGSIQVTFPSSWIGDPGVDVWAMAQNKYADGELDIALTRFDLQDQSGSGLIAQMAIVMPDDISLQGEELTRSGGPTYLSDTL
jgi:hypothetical protein